MLRSHSSADSWAKAVNYGVTTTLSEHQWQMSRPTWNLLENPLHDKWAWSPTEYTTLAGVPGAHILNNVLTDSECTELIERTNLLGYPTDEPAHRGGAQVRTNRQCVLVVPEKMASELADRIFRMVPQLHLSTDVVSISINRRFRFYRYDAPLGGAPVQRFSPHHDGAQAAATIDSAGILREAEERGRSAFSVLLYLNSCDGPGGETAFHADAQVDRGHGKKAEVMVRPQVGLGLVFRHGDHALSPLHEGKPLQMGGAPKSKYVARTDIFLH